MVKQPIYRIFYDGKNITEDLRPDLLSVTYTDNVSGAVDDISITLDDGKGLWKNQWSPIKGDQISLDIGYNDILIPCGVFEVDELKLSGSPDIVSIKAAATSIKNSYRTRNSYAHESKTIRELAQTIATKHGLELTGDVNDEIRIIRATQYQETDLAFLKRISMQFGYIFNIRANQMIFTSIFDLESQSSVIELRKSDLSRYSITDKTAEDYKAAEVRFQNPDDNKLVTGSANWDSQTKDDDLVIWEKAENVKQAEAIARSVLHNKNTRRQTGRFDIEGEPLILSGVNIEIGGLGRLSGIYHVESASHTITPDGGYTTSFSAKKIGEINQNKWL